MFDNRKPPATSPPRVQPKSDHVRQVRRYHLITPLFGGGAEPQQPDEVTVVRASEIRGLLRFWWRATRGGQFNGDLEAMRRAEEAIWGSAAAEGKPGPSEVWLEVKVLNQGNIWRDVEITTRPRKRRVSLGDPRSPYSYVAFPLREEHDQNGSITKPAGSVWRDVEFELSITFPERLREDVEAALWAWETFGGVGARTRRGFGALQLLEVNGQEIPLPHPDNMDRDIRQRLHQHMAGQRWPDGVPHLHPQMPLVVTKRFQSADQAWRNLFKALREFRQARYPDARGRPYGRSKWPEPDAIRRFLLDEQEDRQPAHRPEHPVEDKFPRGQLGLPIIFQFKDEAQGDPYKTVLEAAESERFASRLLLRPVACQNGVVGLACILQGPVDPPGGYVLKRQSSGQVIAHPEAGLTQDEVRLIEPLDGEPDVLKAFLKTLV